MLDIYQYAKLGHVSLPLYLCLGHLPLAYDDRTMPFVCILNGLVQSISLRYVALVHMDKTNVCLITSVNLIEVHRVKKIALRKMLTSVCPPFLGSGANVNLYKFHEIQDSYSFVCAGKRLHKCTKGQVCTEFTF